jgi:hypothetical protein
MFGWDYWSSEILAEWLLIYVIVISVIIFSCEEPDCLKLYLYQFLAYFPYFEKMKLDLWDHVAVCVCLPVYPPIVARQLLAKSPLIVGRQQLGRNVTAVTNTHATIEELFDPSFSMWLVSYQGKLVISCVCVCVSVWLCILPIVARQWLGKSPLIVARQRLGRNITKLTSTHTTIEELLDSFSIWLVSYEGK